MLEMVVKATMTPLNAVLAVSAVVLSGADLLFYGRRVAACPGVPVGHDNVTHWFREQGRRLVIKR
jgi:tryptophanyl-tRNA synthetase